MKKKVCLSACVKVKGEKKRHVKWSQRSKNIIWMGSRSEKQR